MKDYKVYITLEGDNKPHIESIEDIETSLFSEQYELAFKTIDSILLGQENALQDQGTEYENNIVVFSGDRGSGKTSCMMSVAKMLLSKDKNIKLRDYKLASVEFANVDMIDPAFFDADHNVLNLFISRLYKDFASSGVTIKEELKRKILGQFINIQQNLKFMKDTNACRDDVEYLVGLSATISIKQNLNMLIADYLEYIGKPKGKLLLYVDDIDLNEKYASSMVEQLRKFFVLPNVIILMALKQEQLADILTRNYEEEYKKPEDNRKVIIERVNRYLTKLLPQSHRIPMPATTEYIGNELVITDRDKWNYKLPDGLSMSQVILELIYLKTRYLFYNSPTQQSYIVPTNLRDYRQLLKMLVIMNDYADANDNAHEEMNKTVFKNYFFRDWVGQNISSNYKEDINDLAIETSNKELNYKAVSFIASKILNNYINRSSEDEYSYIINYSNQSSNISLGDVYALISTAKRMVHNEEAKKVLFFLSSLYSMRLYETYDAITSSMDHRHSIKEGNLPVVRHTEKDNRPDYYALIGGTLFNQIINPLSKIGFLSTSDDFVILKIEKMKSFFGEVTLKMKTANGTNYVKLLELTMLCVEYAENDVMDPNYRLQTETYYNDFQWYSTRLIFNLGSLLANLTRFKSSIDRFRVFDWTKEFFDNYDYKHYLLADLEGDAFRNRDKDYKTVEEKWLSYCCFRNFEVLDDFYQHVSKTQVKVFSDMYDALRSFFEVASKYQIHTYDRFIDPSSGLPTEPYSIHFHFYSILKDLMDLMEKQDPSIEDFFNSLFEDNHFTHNESASSGDSSSMG